MDFQRTDTKQQESVVRAVPGSTNFSKKTVWYATLFSVGTGNVKYVKEDVSVEKAKKGRNRDITNDDSFIEVYKNYTQLWSGYLSAPDF